LLFLQKEEHKHKRNRKVHLAVALVLGKLMRTNPPPFSAVRSSRPA
jgi:hypothetical protein